MAEEIYRQYGVQRVLRWRRSKRIRYILSMVKTWPGMKVLDVGCGHDGRSFESIVSNDYMITGIDLFDPHEINISHPHFRYHKQDASDLSMFDSKQFDLVISIGMMEHICERSILKQMAREIERVAQQWVIIVPWKYTLIEPHFKFPLFQLLPPSIQKWLTIGLNLHGLEKALRRDHSFISSHYQWLANNEWVKIFRANEARVLPPFFDVVAIIKQTSPTRNCSRSIWNSLFR